MGGGAQRVGGVLDLVGALLLLAADVEQRDARPLQFHRRSRIGRAHHRELDQIARVAFGVRAQVQHHHVVVAQRRQQGGERGAVDPGDHAQRQFGHRHQRAGIARRNAGAGLAALHQIDRDAHRCRLGAANRLARLFLPRDDSGGVDDFGMRGQIGVVFQAVANRGLVADQEEPHFRKAPARAGDAGEHHRQPLIAAHRVDGNPGTGGHRARVPGW